jgi:hypothetical protein
MIKGDKVVCIDVGNIKKLNQYQIYTIYDILTEFDSVVPQIRLIETGYVYYKISRFISLNEYRKIKLQNVENIYN